MRKVLDLLPDFAVTDPCMSKIPTKRIARRKAVAALARRRVISPRRSSYLKPSSDTLASLNEDTSKMPTFRTAEELIRFLEKDGN